jgi:hypothetical protein
VRRIPQACDQLQQYLRILPLACFLTAGSQNAAPRFAVSVLGGEDGGN